MATTESHAMSRPRAALAERATRIRGGRESPFFSSSSSPRHAGT